MTHEQFDTLCEVLFAKVRDLATSKGREYAGAEDRFGNFIRLAARTGMTREQVWLVYFTKHLDSIETYIRERGKVPQSEPIQGRVLDAITYLTLLYGMIEETQLRPVILSGSMGPPEPPPTGDCTSYLLKSWRDRCRCGIRHNLTASGPCKVFQKHGSPSPPSLCWVCAHLAECHSA